MRDYKKILLYYIGGLLLSIRGVLLFAFVGMIFNSIMLASALASNLSGVVICFLLLLLNNLLFLGTAVALTVSVFVTLFLVRMYVDMRKDPYRIDTYAKECHVQLYLKHKQIIVP